jgi:penicillin-binding protein 1A
MPKRPSDSDLTQEEDDISTGEQRPVADDSEGATAFVRVDRAPPPQAPSSRGGAQMQAQSQARANPNNATMAEGEPVDDEPGATAFVRADQAPQNPDDTAGATAFVRLDGPAPQRGPAAPLPPRRPPPGAPKKGLQVTLPDDELAPPPPPKRVVVAPPKDEKKGRRGNWWDVKAEKLPDEPEPPPEEPPAPEPEPEEPSAPEDDAAGATAFVQTAPRKKPQPEPEPEEVYRPVPADDYQGHLTLGPPKWKIWLRRALIAGIALVVAGAALCIGAYIYISREIPTFDSIADYKPFVATKVVTSDGTVVGQFFKERRTVVKMDQIPRVLVQAVISAEDKDFYKHPGFNFIALARAAVVDAISGRKRLGASTITQQVVKNFFLSSEKKWKRKLKEIVLAARLEHNLSKDDILYLYLNQINFGRAHYGVEEASLYYFGKHVQDIDLGEAAILAGLPQNPSRIDPRRHPDRATARRNYVLDRMRQNKFISLEDHDNEVAKPIALPPLPQPSVGGWYLDEVRRQLIAQYGEAQVEQSGLRVEVAMDPKLQAAAESAVQDDLRAVDKRQGWRGAELKLDADRIDAYRAAMSRRLGQVQLSNDSAWVFDLEPLHLAKKNAGAAKKKTDSDDSETAPQEEAFAASAPSPEEAARGARIRPLAADSVYAGIVTSVSSHDATVELAPGIAGSAPFSSMTWARPFKPERATPAPRAPSDVVSVGDVVPVRVMKLSVVRSSSGVRVTRIELALEQTPKVQGAFVGMDLRSRGVLALVGGFDAATSSFNRATQAKRQPGSSFKPFLYAAALDTGKYTAATRVDDSPEVIVDPWTGKPWKPQNFEKDQFDGPMSFRKALAESKNTVAVRLLLDLGLDKVRSMARAAGLVSEVPQSYTAALGTGEVGVLEEVNAYATFASGGRRQDPVLIRKVVARDGSTLFEAKSDAEQTVKPETAYLVSDIMRSVIDDPVGTGHGLMLPDHPAAGKTGTASEHRDGWFVGFTPSLIAGAWVGFDTHEMMGALETGGHVAGPIWLNWMRVATASRPEEDWPQPPPGVTTVQINRNTGKLAEAGDPYAVREVFLAGTEPAKSAESDQPNQEDWYQQPK